MTTALERRHPAILARKRHAERELVRAERFRNGDCTECGHKLDDELLVEGYERCMGAVCYDEAGYVTPHAIAILALLAGFAYIAGHVLTWFLLAGKGIAP